MSTGCIESSSLAKRQCLGLRWQRANTRALTDFEQFHPAKPTSLPEANTLSPSQTLIAFERLSFTYTHLLSMTRF